MLRTLFTPLSGRFPLSPFPARPDHSATAAVSGSPDELAPEDFARDVVIEVMRVSVERLKEAQGLAQQLEELTQIYRIMLENDCTKDVFREMDGFLVLMSIISTMDLSLDPVRLPAFLGAIYVIFQTLSEAIHKSAENSEYFSTVVGYESLFQALIPWFQNPLTTKDTMGYLLSMALHNFSVSTIFKFDPKFEKTDLDKWLDDFDSAFGHIYHPEPLRVLYNSLDLVPEDRAALRYSVYTTLDQLSRRTHRNHCIISSLGITRSLFQAYHSARENTLVSKEERHVLQKLLKRIVDIGLTTDDARIMFQKAVRPDDTLDINVLEILRTGMKVNWPDHFSLKSPASFEISCDNVKGLPASGFTFMTWLWIENFPREHPHTIFAFRMDDQTLFSLMLRPDGNLGCEGSYHKCNMAGSLSKNRWTHVVLVHHPSKGVNPTVKLLIDGFATEILQCSGNAKHISGFSIGDETDVAEFNWCIASAYIISTPFDDDLTRFVHYLGPRYASRFQSASLGKFYTYEASTSCNIALTKHATKKANHTTDVARFAKLLRDGPDLAEASFMATITPAAGVCVREDGNIVGTMQGDIFKVIDTCFDWAMWKIGAAAIPLRLVQIANSPHELSRSLGILVDGLRNSWQNSEDMERLRGYDILAGLLKHHSHLLNMSSFETLFEFLGMNFRSPNLSTIVNIAAYQSIALDFRLWSSTSKDIQVAYLEHFPMLLRANKFKHFNVKQRIAKLSIVRKLLFALQSDWFHIDVYPSLVEAITVTAQVRFTPDDAIKPIVSFIVANLQSTSQTLSPRSPSSAFETTQVKAELILGTLVTLLQSPSAYSKFTSTLPMPRICLLLLGEHPSPSTVAHILRIIEISIKTNPSFHRKFELVSGWNILKTLLPLAWNQEVHNAVFDVLLQPAENDEHGQYKVICPPVLNAILASLSVESQTVEAWLAGKTTSTSYPATDSDIEKLLDKLIEVYSASPSFRQLFKSQATTATFVASYRLFLTSISSAVRSLATNILIIDKFAYLASSITANNTISSSQKAEISELLRATDSVRSLLSSGTPTTDLHGQLDSFFADKHSSASAKKLDVQLGDGATRRTLARLNDWRGSVIKAEESRLRKTILDMREQTREVSALTEWATTLIAERGLWERRSGQRHWQLDDTEGPYRVRLKFRHNLEQVVSSKVDTTSQINAIEDADDDAQSSGQLQLPPWAEAYEISSTDMDEPHLHEDIHDDKLRRIRPSLEPGDDIDAVYTVARISGIDSSPGLLILGRNYIYMFDGLIENDDGEVINAHDAPHKVFVVPGSTMQIDRAHNCDQWSHEQIVAFSNRTFLFRDIVLEIYFRDGRSLLIIFSDQKHRQSVTKSLDAISKHFNAEPPTPGLLKSPAVSGLLGDRSSMSLGAKMFVGLGIDELSTAQRKWQAREISNFAYLSILNQVSGRTPGDATQYPVFPWVLSDYASESLDLTAASSFRDLTSPMGALTSARREAAESRYSNLESVGETPFHYGTHFSSSMIVCHFLIRMEPFTHMFKTLQGGDWDLPDRLFIDIQRAYQSSSQDTRGDVRELIPEFFNCPEFLVNSSNLDFGLQSNTGERIHDVKLPPWAKQDPLLFVTMNRAALESDHVSEYLPKWIDLIWGCKQRDRESLNVFHPLSYEGSVDLDSIKDDLERQATVSIIHNFGQTPRQLFSTPHPERWMHGNSALPIGTLYGIAEDYNLLYRSTKALKDIGPGVPVQDLAFDAVARTVVPCPPNCLLLPSSIREQITWDISDGTLRLVQDRKIIQVMEATYCTCAAFADSTTLVTGSSDQMVRLWTVKSSVNASASHRSSIRASRITLTHIMRAHTSNVICVAASRAWSLVVSGSQDGTAVLWDLNRGVYVRSISHGTETNDAVHLVAINESTGFIATCSRHYLRLHTINSWPIASLDLTNTAISHIYPPITSIAFLERHYSRVGVLATGGPDSTITLRSWNTDATPPGQRAEWQFTVLKTLKAEHDAGNRRATKEATCITALNFVGESLFHGEDNGKVFQWTFPE